MPSGIYERQPRLSPAAQRAADARRPKDQPLTQTIAFPELLPWGVPCFLIYERIVGADYIDGRGGNTRHGLLIGATLDSSKIPKKHKSRIRNAL